MALFSLRLNKDEEVLTIIRRSPVTFLGTLFRFLIISAILVCFYLFLPQEQWKVITVIILGILALIFLGYRFIVWYLVGIIITNERIIDVNQKSLTSRVITEIFLGDISQISCFREGIIQRIFNLGSIVIEVKEGGKIVCFNMKRPEEIMNRINRLKHSNGTIFPKMERKFQQEL